MQFTVLLYCSLYWDLLSYPSEEIALLRINRSGVYNCTIWSLVRIKGGVLGVKVYGSRHPMSKRTGTLGWRRSEKVEKQVEYAGAYAPTYQTNIYFHTYGPCEDQRRSVGSESLWWPAPLSQRTGDTGVANMRKEWQTRGVHQPWGQGDGAEVGHLEPGGMRD